MLQKDVDSELIPEASLYHILTVQIEGCSEVRDVFF